MDIQSGAPAQLRRRADHALELPEQASCAQVCSALCHG